MQQQVTEFINGGKATQNLVQRKRLPQEFNQAGNTET